MMLLGSDGVFVGSGVFKSSDPEKTAKAIVQAVAHWNDPEIIARVSEGMGDPMKGQSIQSLSEQEKTAKRGI
jgi:pyridoxal 5'-phosphate synthase pdxS subunit